MSFRVCFCNGALPGVFLRPSRAGLDDVGALQAQGGGLVEQNTVDNMRIYLYISIYMHIHIYIYIHTHTYIRAYDSCVCKDIRLCMHVCICMDLRMKM